MRAVPDISTSDFKAVAGASAVFDASMGSTEFWVFTSNTNCYINQHASAPVASAADGSLFVAAGASVLISGKHGAKLAVIQDSAGGSATLCRAILF